MHCIVHAPKPDRQEKGFIQSNQGSGDREETDKLLAASNLATFILGGFHLLHSPYLHMDVYDN